MVLAAYLLETVHSRECSGHETVANVLMVGAQIECAKQFHYLLVVSLLRKTKQVNNSH